LNFPGEFSSQRGFVGLLLRLNAMRAAAGLSA
jgi:hypothetical protein